MDNGVMAGTTAAMSDRHSRVEHIRELAAAIGVRVRKMLGLVAVMLRVNFYFTMGACLIAAPIAYGTEKHQVADVVVFSGAFLFFGRISVRWLSHTLTRMVSDLIAQTEAELAGHRFLRRLADETDSGDADGPIGPDTDAGAAPEQPHPR
jgi:hypothetical protein